MALNTRLSLNYRPGKRAMTACKFCLPFHVEWLAD